jgi:hypothetical protein
MAALCGCDAVPNAATKFNPFASFETRCARLPASLVEVVPDAVTPTEDYSLSHQSLTRLAQEDPDAQRTLGLTRTTFGEEARIDIMGLEDSGSHRACARPQVHVRLRMSPMTVYVAREIEGDACRKAALLEHEMKHVEVYRKHLNAAAAELARALPALYGQRIFTARSSGETETELRGMLRDYLGAFMQASARQLKADQEKVDSAEEYDRIGRACGGMPAAG